MKLKEGVDIRFLRPELGRYLPNIEAILNWHASDPDFEFVLTSANDGTHSPGSLHFKNRALDIRVWHLTKKQRRAICADIRKLDPALDVVDEGSHLHVEHDPD